ncbi:unnamed protein product [Boreogadus saida]
MSRKTLAWANKEVETFVCILGEEDVVYDVYVAAAVIDIRPTTKGTVGSGNATSELSWAIPPPPYRTFAIRSVPHPAVETRHNGRGDVFLCGRIEETKMKSGRFVVLIPDALRRRTRDFREEQMVAPLESLGDFQPEPRSSRASLLVSFFWR